jgi:hypothetical protein
MHAIVVHAAIRDLEETRQVLRDETLPMLSALPGFVTGWWLAPVGGKGLAVVVFESEEAVRNALTMVQAGPHPFPFATRLTTEVREVVCHA